MNYRRIKISKESILIVFSALYIILPTYFTVGGFTVRNLLVILTIALWALLCSKYKMLHLYKSPIFTALFIWTFVTVAVTLIHGYYTTAIFRAAVWFGMTIIFVSSIDTKQKFMKVIDAVVYEAGIICILGIIEEITHYDVFFLLNNSGSSIETMNRMRMGILRLLGFTSHPITYCVYCMFVMSLVFYRITLLEKCRKKFFFSFIYILLIINAGCTVSRSAILCLILSQVLLLWACGLKRFIYTAVKYIFIIAIAVGILCLISENIRNIVYTALVLFLAIFSDDYANTLVSLGYSDNNVNGIGQRFQLYVWVWEDVKNRLLIGFGPDANLSTYFINSAGYRQLKESIEVQYLRTLYRYGILSMISEILFYIVSLVKSFKKRRKKAEWENKLSFSSVFCCTLLAYLIIFFAVMQNEDAQIFFIFFVLYASYFCHNRFDDKTAVC